MTQGCVGPSHNVPQFVLDSKFGHRSSLVLSANMTLSCQLTPTDRSVLLVHYSTGHCTLIVFVNLQVSDPASL